MSTVQASGPVRAAAARVPVGRTTVQDRATQAPVDVVVMRNPDDRFHSAPAVGYYLEVDRQQVGYLLINKDQLSYPGQVYIEYMNATEGNARFRGLGTRMHQIAAEESLNRFGRLDIRFDSEPRAVMFHHHNGYRLRGLGSADEHQKRLTYIAEEMEDPYGIHKFDMRMTLSLEGDRAWQQRILTSPILEESRDHRRQPGQ